MEQYRKAKNGDFVLLRRKKEQYRKAKNGDFVLPWRVRAVQKAKIRGFVLPRRETEQYKKCGNEGFVLLRETEQYRKRKIRGFVLLLESTQYRRLPFEELKQFELYPTSAAEFMDGGHVDDETPSFAISLYEPFRQSGIGTAMMKTMLKELQSLGCKQASLAVQKANYAVKMYRNVGFEIIGESEEEFIMVCGLAGKIF